MKSFSSNIKAKAGIAAISGLNVFPAIAGNTDLEAFSEAMHDALGKAERIALDEAPFYEDSNAITIAALSIPRLRSITDKSSTIYALDGGFLVFANWMISPGALFSFDRDGSLVYDVCETGPKVERATLVHASMVRLKYDTYNALALEDISQEVLDELDITVDISQVPTDCINAVRYMAIYAPLVATLDISKCGRVIAYDPGNDYLEERRDQFLVEWVDTTQEFAYVAIEVAGTPAVGCTADAASMYNDDPSTAEVDFNRVLFDKDNRAEYATHSIAEVLADLRAISEELN